MIRRLLTFFCIFALLNSALHAADGPAPANDKKPAPPPGKWVDISDKLIGAIIKSGKTLPWPGQTGGVAVDPSNGDVYVVVVDSGVWRSTDHGATYARVDQETVGGRAETGFSLDVNPAGARMMCFMVGGSSAMLINNGQTTVKSKATNMNFGAVDWNDGQTLLAVRHETRGWGWLSVDGATTWKDMGPGYECVGVFDDHTFVAVKGTDPGIQRSEDKGATWEKVSDLAPSGRAMRVFKGVGYWTSKKGLLVSRNKGEKWIVQGAEVEMSTGPYFGTNEFTFVVAGKDGLLKTEDAGLTWTLVAPYPDKMKYEPRGWFGSYGWDPINDILYASVMGQPAYRFEPAGKSEPAKTDAEQK